MLDQKKLENLQRKEKENELKKEKAKERELKRKENIEKRIAVRKTKNDQVQKSLKRKRVN